MDVETSFPSPDHTQWVEMCNRYFFSIIVRDLELSNDLTFRKIPRSVVCHILQLLDRRSLANMAQVSRTFR